MFNQGLILASYHWFHIRTWLGAQAYMGGCTGVQGWVHRRTWTGVRFEIDDAKLLKRNENAKEYYKKY